MGLEKVQRNEHLFLKNFCDKRNAPLPQSRFMPTLHRKNNGSTLLPLVKNKREYKYDTHCPFRVRQWVEIVAEGTTPQHLLGGYKTRRRRAECDDEAKLCRSYRYGPKISADNVMNISSKTASVNPHRHTHKI